MRAPSTHTLKLTMDKSDYGRARYAIKPHRGGFACMSTIVGRYTMEGSRIELPVVTDQLSERVAHAMAVMTANDVTEGYFNLTSNGATAPRRSEWR